ncbi:MAG: hypothetical protein WCG50_14400 [Rhodoferax sp.]|uniref:hypothetical protein n=1 Tax=Rhodoferax sp. TaxID=50421 RepID=UPI00301A1A55
MNLRHAAQAPNMYLPFMRKAFPSPLIRLMAIGQLQELRRLGLTWLMIRALLRALLEETQHYRIADAMPTIGDDRQSLRAVQSLALELLEVLQNSFRVSCDIGAGQMIQSLGLFSDGCSERLRFMPTQSRRRNHVNIIARVAAITAPLKIHISAREGTRFFRICKASFSLAGVTKAAAKKGTNKRQQPAPPSPSASIRSFIKAERPDTEGPLKTTSFNLLEIAGHCVKNSPGGEFLQPVIQR